MFKKKGMAPDFVYANLKQVERVVTKLSLGIFDVHRDRTVSIVGVGYCNIVLDAVWSNVSLYQ